MSASSSDRNVLFGVLALQMEFITQAGLIAALQAWTLQKTRPLGELLVELGHMSAEDRAALEPMVDRHVARHGGRAEQSLAALSSLSDVAAELRELNDADVQHSLQHVEGQASRQAGSVSGVVADEDPPQLQPTLLETMQEEAQPAMRFQLLRPHAEGGLGKVWIARDRELNREVAFKEIKSKRAQDTNSRARFVLEAEITGGLEHPGIVPVYGLGHFADGRPFYAMRFIRGRSLKEAIEQFHHTAERSRHAPRDEPNASHVPSADNASNKQPPSPASARHAERDGYVDGERGRTFRNLIQRLIDVCNAIAYAHSRGVLHRDLKPGNIMLGKYGETLVVDWGLAKAKGQSFDPAASVSAESIDHEPMLSTTGSKEVASTQMGSAIGTPKFMSPEQAAGRLDLLGPPADVYSLGATLYELLTGQAPIGTLPGGGSERLTIPEVLRRVEQGAFPAPCSVLPQVPAALEAVCLKAMSRSTGPLCDGSSVGRGLGALAGGRPGQRLCHSDLLTLKGHTGVVWSVAFSADGKRLASASMDQTVKVWDATSNKSHVGPGRRLQVFKSECHWADAAPLARESVRSTLVENRPHGVTTGIRRRQIDWPSTNSASRSPIER